MASAVYLFLHGKECINGIMVDVLCIGHAAYDINLPLDAYPVENSKIQVDAFFEEGGGPAANAAYLLSLWGVKCAFAGLVGNDEYGRRIIDDFKAVNTDISMMKTCDKCPTPLSVILVNRNNGSRTIINRKVGGYYLDVSGDLLKELNPKLMLFDGHEPFASLKAIEVFPCAKTILDAGSLRSGTEMLYQKVDYLVASERFALAVSGLPALDDEETMQKCIERLYRENNRHVVVTLGERGLIYAEKGRFNRLPAYKAKAVDTTAAGDIFHGAFAYGILMGMSFHETLKLASMAAAMSVEVSGGRRSIPSLERVRQALLNQNGQTVG